MFLQETHSSKEGKQKWWDNFNGNTFFSHSMTNLCGILISYTGTHNFLVNNQKIDNDDQISILDVTINNALFLLINLYNGETVFVFNNLSSRFENFDLTLEKT